MQRLAFNMPFSGPGAGKMYHVKIVIAEIDIGAESPQDLQGLGSFIQQADGAGNYISSFVNGIRQRNGETEEGIQ